MTRTITGFICAFCLCFSIVGCGGGGSNTVIEGGPQSDADAQAEQEAYDKEMEEEPSEEGEV